MKILVFAIAAMAIAGCAHQTSSGPSALSTAPSSGDAYAFVDLPWNATITLLDYDQGWGVIEFCNQSEQDFFIDYVDLDGALRSIVSPRGVGACVKNPPAKAITVRNGSYIEVRTPFTFQVKKIRSIE